MQLISYFSFIKSTRRDLALCQSLRLALVTGVHSVYNTKVSLELHDIITKKGQNITPQVAEEELIKLINKIKVWINNNPGFNLNNITF